MGVRPTYIRHIHGSQRTSSAGPDVFARPHTGKPYRDLIKLHHIVDENTRYIYTLGKCLYPPGFESVSSMQRWMVVYVVQGRLRFRDRVLTPGDFVYIPPAISHILTSPRGETPLYYWFTSDDAMLRPLLQACGFGEDAIVGHCAEGEQVSGLMERMIYRPHGSADYRVFFVGVFGQLLSYFSRDAAGAGENLSVRLFERCLTYIEYRSGLLTVDELAKNYHVSRQYLYQIFRQNGGASPQTYIMEAKMKSADKFLLTTDYSITQIAEHLRYNNYNHFSQAYKRFYGILPRERRRQAMGQHGPGQNPPG